MATACHRSRWAGRGLHLRLAALRHASPNPGLTPVRETLGSDFRASIRHIPACAVFFVVLIVLMNWASNYSDQSWQISGYFFTRLPHVLQRSVGEVRFHEWVQIKFAVLIWFVLPALFLPFLSAASASGFSRRGLWAALRVYARVKYWLAIAVAALIGVLLPRLLASYIPSHGLTKETVSMVLRLFTVYALAVLAWLMASAVVGSFLRANLPVENPGGNAALWPTDQSAHCAHIAAPAEQQCRVRKRTRLAYFCSRRAGSESLPSSAASVSAHPSAHRRLAASPTLRGTIAASAQRHSTPAIRERIRAAESSRPVCLRPSPAAYESYCARAGRHPSRLTGRVAKHLNAGINVDRGPQCGVQPCLRLRPSQGPLCRVEDCGGVIVHGKNVQPRGW